jgi:hypothetical protein
MPLAFDFGLELKEKSWHNLLEKANILGVEDDKN